MTIFHLLKEIVQLYDLSYKCTDIIQNTKEVDIFDL